MGSRHELMESLSSAADEWEAVAPSVAAVLRETASTITSISKTALGFEEAVLTQRVYDALPNETRQLVDMAVDEATAGLDVEGEVLRRAQRAFAERAVRQMLRLPRFEEGE